ncbi:MAG: ATP-dependent helicase [Candidatus Diapherotrites archaeon]
MIKLLTQKYAEKEIYASLHPLLGGFFKHHFNGFTEPQQYSIVSIHRRENILVSAPTGTGKTLSAFAAVLSELMHLSDAEQLEEHVYCVYVSPLRALSNDIEKNLNQPLDELQKAAEKIGKKYAIRIGVRTGDTPTHERQQMTRKPPHILITTPETLAIVLASPKFSQSMKNTRWCIIDEIHSLASGKRGTQLALTTEALQRLSPNMTRIGLSATVAPLEEIAHYLVGNNTEGKPRPCQIVDVSSIKEMDMKVISPLSDLINTTQKKMDEAVYRTLDDLIGTHRTTLIFTNTRAATERVVHHLKEKYPSKYEGLIGAHHSSLSRTHRLQVENRLKNGELKVCVSSTSLELGIDIGFIDLVILLGSPKGVARALQRTGRSGHKLHDTVKGRIVVLDRDDLIECGVLLKNALEKKIDRVYVPKNCLDVLAQHIFGLVVNEPRNIEEVYEEIRRAYPYQTLPRTDFQEVLDYLSGVYAGLEVRHVYAKIWIDEKTGMMGKRGKLARVIYMTNVGTIPDEAKVKVKIGEHIIGTFDEAFMDRLKKGDTFVLGGNTLEFQFARGMTVQAKSASGKIPTVPSWVSEMLPLSYDLAVDIQKFRRLMNDLFSSKKSKKEILAFIDDYLYVDKNAGNAIYEYFNQQYRFAQIPRDGHILLEQVKMEGMTYFVFHTLYGRRVNDALSRAYAYTLGRMIHQDVDILLGDNGFALRFGGKASPEKLISLVHSWELPKIMNVALRTSEVLRRRFRHCATRAFMILRTYRGRTKTVGRQQMSSRLLLSAVQRMDENFSILREARREVVEDLMDLPHAKEIVTKIEQGMIKVTILPLDTFSPFSFNLIAQGHYDVIRLEDRLTFIKRMHEKVLQHVAQPA